MAVDTSRSHQLVGLSEELYYNVLYFVDNNNTINRFVWTDYFERAVKDSSYTIIPDAGWNITALAANKDGVFVALLKNGNSPSGNHVYGVKINHYNKVSKALLGTITVVSDGTSGKENGFNIEEGISAMHIQDGVLYALTVKGMKKDDFPKRIFTSGKLWYISTTSNFRYNKRLLYSSIETGFQDDMKTKNFTPVRFIAVKPQKLVIASDGVYGEHNDVGGVAIADNFDKVFTFDIGSWQKPDVEELENTAFTRVIKRLTSGSGYDLLH